MSIRPQFHVWVMVGACFAAMETGHFDSIELPMNSSAYQSILESTARPSVWQLKLGWNWVMQEGNDPHHTNRSAAEWQNQSVSMIQSAGVHTVHRPMLVNLNVTKSTLTAYSHHNCSIYRAFQASNQAHLHAFDTFSPKISPGLYFSTFKKWCHAFMHIFDTIQEKEKKKRCRSSNYIAVQMTGRNRAH